MKKLTTVLTLVGALLPVFFAPLAQAELPSGDTIAENINTRNEGTALARDLKMEMTDRRGKKRVRETRAFRKYYGTEKRTVIFYLSPKNVKKTAFLTYDYADKTVDDDQWLYLPALRKVRRISASDRGDYFLGTDFSYEDIKLETRVSIDEYTRKTVGEGEEDGVHCIIVEETVVNDEVAKELGHLRRENCVDDEIWMVRRSKVWDLQDNLLKTIYFRDISKIQDIWTAHITEVENHATGHHTKFTFSNVSYDNGVKDSIFSKSTLRRGL